MQQQEGTFKSTDGKINLYWQKWLPEGETKAVVVLAHGLGEYSGRYHHVAQALTEQGYAFYALDHYGHGKSGGPRGHAPSYNVILDDFEQLIQMAQQDHPEKKVFVYGHSMGGNIVLNYALRRPQGFSGVIATGPWLRLPDGPSGPVVTILKLLSRVVPTFTIDNGLDLDNLSRDRAVVEAYQNDPLVHPKISLRLASEMASAAEWALKAAPQLTLPALLMHGGADHLTGPAGTREFYENAGGSDKTHREWEGLYHEIHNEPEQEQVFEFMLGWLDEHL